MREEGAGRARRGRGGRGAGAARESGAAARARGGRGAGEGARLARRARGGLVGSEEGSEEGAGWARVREEGAGRARGECGCARRARGGRGAGDARAWPVGAKPLGAPRHGHMGHGWANLASS